MTHHDQALVRLSHRWFEEVWNRGNVAVIDEMLDPECVVYGVNDGEGNPVLGPTGFKPFWRKLRASFPDIHITIEDCLVKGDKVALRCRVQATHGGDTLGIAATHKPIDFTGMCIARLESGIIVEVWNNFDFMGMYQQVGLLPAFEVK